MSSIIKINISIFSYRFVYISVSRTKTNVNDRVFFACFACASAMDRRMELEGATVLGQAPSLLLTVDLRLTLPPSLARSSFWTALQAKPHRSSTASLALTTAVMAGRRSRHRPVAAARASRWKSLAIPRLELLEPLVERAWQSRTTVENHSST